MTVFNVSNAQQLTAALSSAHGGDTILLAAGNYGRLNVQQLNYSSNVTVQSASASSPAVFSSMVLTASSNITFSNVSVAFTPDTTTKEWTPAVSLQRSSNISIVNSTITGGPAVAGVAQSATALDASGAVIGLPTGIGVQTIGSNGITLSNNNISQFGKGVEIDTATSVNIVGNNIHNLRQSGLDMSNVNNVSISSNTFSNNNPWAWNQSYGDHGDFIHIYNNPKQNTGPNSNISITNNIISQGAGKAILGINLNAYDANGQQLDDAFGFTNVNISNNAIVNGNAQGIRLEKVSNSTISNNVMIQPSGTTAAPGILFALGGVNNTVSNNLAGSIANEEAAANATYKYSNNHLVQDQNQAQALWFDPAVAAKAGSMTSASAIYSLVWNALPSTTTNAVYSGTAANIAANLDVLNANTNITSVVISNNAPVVLSVARWQTDTRALSELKNQNGSKPSLTISDKAATLVSNFDALNAGANIGSIVVSDSQTLWLSAAQGAKDANALAKLVNANGSALSVGLNDTAANISAQFNALTASPMLRRVVVSDHGVLTLTAAQYIFGQAFLKTISGSYGLVLHDTAANIGAHIDQLQALTVGSNPHFTSAVVTDNGAVQLSVAQMNADYQLLGKLSGQNGAAYTLKISDTAANISANIDLLAKSTHVSSIVVADNQPIAISAAQWTTDSKVLGEVVTTTGTNATVSVASGASSMSVAPVSGAAISAPAIGNFYGDGKSGMLIQNANGAVEVGELGSNGQAAFAQVGSLGTAWRFDGSGDYLGDGKAQFLIENTNGAVDLGQVGANGQATYTQIGALGSQWTFVGSGDYLGLGRDQFLTESTTGALDVGTVGSNRQASYQQVGALDTTSKVVGSGDFRGDGRTQFLVESTSGALNVGEVGSNGQAAYAQVGTLGSDWTFKGVGDFLGDGKTQFLIENANGVVDLGEVGANGQATLTQIAQLGSEWKFVGAGDYAGKGVSSFLIENTNGAIDTGTVVNGKAQLVQVSSLGSAWSFRG